jgi:hypothetical protein
LTSPARCSRFGNVALDIALAAVRGQMTLHQLANVRLASLASRPLDRGQPREAVFFAFRLKAPGCFFWGCASGG